MRQAVVLVGGRGTRLGALAERLPKPLMPIVQNVTFLDLLLDNVARHGIEDILLLAGHLGALIAERYDGMKIRDARARVIIEPAPAGTGGALQYAAASLDDLFLMTNGDSYLDLNYLALERALVPEVGGVIALRRVEDAARYGRVETADGRIRAFREKDSSHIGAALISGGVYLLRKEVLDRIDRLPCSIETDIFPGLASEGRLATMESDGYFIDIGLPDTLKEAQTTLLARITRGALFLDATLLFANSPSRNKDALVRQYNDTGGLVFGIGPVGDSARDEISMRLRSSGAHIDGFYSSPACALGEWRIDLERVAILGGATLQEAVRGIAPKARIATT